MRGHPGAADDSGIVKVLFSDAPGASRPMPGRVNPTQTRMLARAMIEAGIRPSNKHRRVGEYRLGAVIAEGESYQDWEGQHVSVASVRRRVRIYTFANAATEEVRKSLIRQASREFQILEGIDHPGILKVRDYQETELGPALIICVKV